MGCIEPCDTSPLQAIMLSICLQSMVDELMVKKSGGSIRKVRVGTLEWDPNWPCDFLGSGRVLSAPLGMGPASPGPVIRPELTLEPLWLSCAPPCRCFGGG